VNVARRKAKELGEKRYMGKPCYKNHSGLRYVGDGSCVTCSKERSMLCESRTKRHRNKYISIPNWGMEYDKRVVAPLRKHFNYDNEALIIIALSKFSESVRERCAE
jgi:hypothetical protein